MSLKTTKINNHRVKPIQLGGSDDNRPILGAGLIPHLYCTMFLVAKKNSGKTTTKAKIVNECVGRDTHVIVFSSTLNHDKTWEGIKALVHKNRATFTGYTSLFDERGSNRLADLLSVQEHPKGSPFQTLNDEPDITQIGLESVEIVTIPVVEEPKLNFGSNLHLLDKLEETIAPVKRFAKRTNQNTEC